MIERRRPILSAIANRKMFMGGGLATPMPQPTYMDLMPQQMGLPREAQGIMASSQPLVDAIASDANNPYGGDTLSMAQGGVAKFQRGGVQYDPATAVTRAQRTRSENLQTLFPPERAAGLLDQIGIGKGPGELYSDEPSFTRRMVGMIPGRAGTALEGAAEVGETIGNVVDSFLGARFRGQKNILSYLFSEEEEASGRSLNERYGLTEILSRISPELKQQNPNIERDILEIGANLIGKTGSQQEFMEAVADQYAKQQEAGYAAAMADVNRGQVDAVSDEGFPAPQQPGDIVMPGDEGEFYREELNKKIDEYRVAMSQGPEAQMKFAQDLSADSGFSQAFKDEVFQSADVGPPVNVGRSVESDFPGLVPTSPESDFEGLVPISEEEEATVPRPKEKPPVPDIAQGQTAATVDTAPSATGETTPDTSAPAQVAKAFDKPMTKPEAEKTIEDYKKDFMKAMPEYDGVSEEEKGYRFIEAGLRVMAGQSPNAIENIANGLKGLGAEFAKDEKEKRAYDRQVDLSAANYALGAIAKDVAQDRADERNRIIMYDMTDPKNPKAVSVGMDEIIANDGKLPDNLVGEKIMSAKVKAANDATVRLRTLLSENAKSMRITATEAKDLRDSLGKARESFVSGESGIQLLSQVKARVAAGGVTGFGAAGKELIRQAFAAAGKQDLLGQKYKNLSEAREEIRRAFQALIPISLGSTQTANSISNRDVQFLADAYVNSGFLENGVFSFATVNDETLGQQLEGAIGKFRDRQKEGLADYDRVLSRINSAEQAFQDARGSGIFVSPGPFTSSYFDPITKEIDPYAQKTRAVLEGRTAKPVFTYEFKDGVYRRVPAR